MSNFLFCGCGCGKGVKPGMVFVQGHNQKGRKLSDEHKRKISESLMGHPGASLGVKRSDNFKRKLSIANTGKTHSDETKKRISEMQTGKKHSEETKKRIAYSNKIKWVGAADRKYEQSERNKKGGWMVGTEPGCLTCPKRCGLVLLVRKETNGLKNKD